MFDRPLDCLVEAAADARPIQALRPAELEDFLASAPAGAFLRESGFTAASGELRLLPGGSGVAGAVLGLGDRTDRHMFGALPFGLPEGDWRLEPGSFERDEAVLGFCLGAYQFTALKTPGRPPARLVAEATGRACQAASATWLARDLINMPANLLGPAELAQVLVDMAARFGARSHVTSGDALSRDYPTVAAVAAGSDRPGAVAVLRWQGSTATADAPLLALCGKGVCFDTGGYDLKPSAGMLRMKKDMGGAALTLGLAQMIMAADLPIRLALWVGCVENSISGRAMRPSDVLRTRAGLTVEIGNTDAEGRLVLCDLLTEACAEQPRLLIDAATLTGAARVALGPDIVAMFSNDDAAAAAMQDAGLARHDPVWRLPLWPGYESWLASPVADLNNVSAKPFAGAIVAGLFLQRFVQSTVPWIHLDTYAWNDTNSPSRPEGGEALAMQACFQAIFTIFNL